MNYKFDRKGFRNIFLYSINQQTEPLAKMTTTPTDTIRYCIDLFSNSSYTIDAHKYEKECQKPGKNLYEYVNTGNPVKLYLDVDIKRNDRIDIALAPMIQEEVEDFLQQFFENEGLTYVYENVGVGSSHCESYKPSYAVKDKQTGCMMAQLKPYCIGKISFHFVLNDFISHIPQQHQLVKRLNREAKSYIERTNPDNLQYYTKTDDKENKVFEMFDESVYSSGDQKIRSPYANKPLENRPMKIERGKFEQLCITAFIPDDAFLLNEPIPEVMKTEYAESSGEVVNEITRWKFEQYIHAGLLTPYAQSGYFKEWRLLCWIIWHTFSDRKMVHSFSRLGKDGYDEDATDRLIDISKPERARPFRVLEIYAYKTDKKTASNILREADRMTQRIEGRNVLFETVNEDPDTDGETNSEVSIENPKPAPAPAPAPKEEVSYYIKLDELQDPYSCAIVVSNTLKHTLVLCKEKWYCINDKNLWLEVKDPTYYITRETRKYVTAGNLQIAIDIDNEKDPKKQKDLLEIQEKYKNMFMNISKPAFLNVLTKNLKSLLCDNLFMEKLDRLTDCLAFKNGVYNMKTRKFRRGIEPSDFITDTIQHNYTPANPTKTEYVKNALLKIMNNNNEHLEYFLSVIGYTFIGRANLEKAFYFCVDKTLQSKGDNGKTFYFDILTELMPCYVYNTKGTFLEKDNAKKHKQLTLMKGKRLVWLDEFGMKNIDPVFVKELANGLATENEVMFGTSEKINVQFKVFGLTNHTVKIGDNEDAVFNRYVQISYGSHFDKTGTLKEDKPEELRFMANATLRDTLLSQYASEIFGLIIEYANKYYTGKLPKIPDQFARDIQETKMANDELGLWLQENCIVDTNGRIAIDTISRESGIPKKKAMERMKQLGYKYNKDLSGLGKNEFGKANKGGYEGIKLIEKEEEIVDMEDQE